MLLLAAPAVAGVMRPVPELLTARVVASYPHDPEAFTQGLLYHDGFLYESTGLNGRSSLRRVEIETGEVVQRRDLDREYFAEGLTVLDGRLVLLTYLRERAFLFDLESFEPVGEFTYRGQGWGLCYDGERLVMSNGTDRLVFLDPETFTPLGEVRVHEDGGRIGRLNELEFIDGHVWANVWGEDRIARIDPRTGRVTAWLDLDGLGAQHRSGSHDRVLNGIAWDGEGGRLFVTGKHWTEVYEIEIIPEAKEEAAAAEADSQTTQPK